MQVESDKFEASGPTISVVIPGYKQAFLSSALESLSKQTDRSFEVVVGDDGSPENLLQICNAFNNRLQLRYHRFDENLGSRSLVSHWSRSIDLAKGDWIWLMGDDDELEPRCIESVKSAIQASDPGIQLWHVDTVQIDADGHVIKDSVPFPERLHPLDFVKGRMASHYSSFACEYIFRKAEFHKRGGFLDFPLGWCSDDATWIRLAAGTAIKTVRALDAKARWRLSTQNISGAGAAFHLPKLEARLLYLEWLCSADGRKSMGVSPCDELSLGATSLDWLLSCLHSTRTIVPAYLWWNTLHRLSAATHGNLLQVAWKMARMQRWTRTAAGRST